MAVASYNTKILVTGSTGFLGRHLLPILFNIYGKEHVVGLSSSNFNLLIPNQARLMFEHYKPEVVIHLAAYSGGIGANRKYPADFFYNNSLLVANVFQEAARYNVKKLIYTMGGCSYPANVASPISESSMWEGYPQEESAGYSVAKKIGLVAAKSYSQQYGLNSVILIPGNMYGEYDNFRIDESHVVPAMIRRYFESTLKGDKSITMWGDGSPLRDFVYAGDVASVLPWFIENYNSCDPINISTGTKTSIFSLANTIKLKLNWEGSIEWDVSKPNGQIVKIFDVTKLNSLGLFCKTTLECGLERTIDWLQKNYCNRTDGIRL